MSTEPVQVDPTQIARFANALFLHASEGGFVSIRGFYDDELARKRNEGAFKIRTIRLNGDRLTPIIEGTTKLAEEAALAVRPVVVCPPLATFSSGKARREELARRVGAQRRAG